MLAYDTKLIVLPFLSLNEDDLNFEFLFFLKKKYNIYFLIKNRIDEMVSTNNSFIINLPTLGIRNIKDFIFLYGYYEPTLLILYEPTLTWTGYIYYLRKKGFITYIFFHDRRLAFHKDTVCLVALSLSLEKKIYPIIWSFEKLPYDSFCLINIPEPIGGALVFSPNQILYFNQNHYYGIGLNDFAFSNENPFNIGF